MTSRGAAEFEDYTRSLAVQKAAGKALSSREQTWLDQGIIAGAVPSAEPFRWRSSARDGNRLYLPSEMETRHVFYTLLMIWNHSMPIEARTPGYKKYSFGPFYTPEYMKKAIVALTIELGTRTDMRSDWQRTLRYMITWLKKGQITGGTEND